MPEPVNDTNLKLTNIQISGFRGIPQTLNIPLLKNNNLSSSLIILGDNGTGKSTIIDAIEFGLQNRIGQANPLLEHTKNLPLLPNLNSDTTPTVNITLNNGVILTRELLPQGSGTGEVLPSMWEVLPEFRFAPIALKREHILQFLANDYARANIFLDYLTPVDDITGHLSPLQEWIQVEAVILRKLQHIAGVLGINTLDSQKEDLLIEIRDVLFSRLADVNQGKKTRPTPLDLNPNKPTSKTGDNVSQTVRETSMLMYYEFREVENLIAYSQELKGTLLSEQDLSPKQAVQYLLSSQQEHAKKKKVLVEEALHGVSVFLTEAFLNITSASHVNSIQVVLKDSPEKNAVGSLRLDLIVRFKDGREFYPQQVFSEGYQDVLAVLLFMAVAERAVARGQAKILLLDDVFQSVDGSIRKRTVDYMLKKFKSWQFIFTVHDRLWFEQLKSSLRSARMSFLECEIRGWDFMEGPVLREGSVSLTSGLELMLENGDPSSISSLAGRLLEQACDQLSWRLETRVRRKENDRYTLGDLWDPVRRALTNWGYGDLTGRLEESYYLRNIHGAHYNEWAENISSQEAQTFGRAVLELVNSLYCKDCASWVRIQNRCSLKCGCGNINYQKPDIVG